MNEDFDYDLGQKKDVITYPQWLNGNSLLEAVGGLSYTGGLIIEDKRMPEGVSIPGFTAATIKLNRQNVNVIGSTDVQLAILGYRLRYFTGEGENRAFYAQSEYEAATEAGHKLRGNLQVCAYLKGFNKPVFISFNGTASSQMISQIKTIRDKALPVTAKQINDQEVTMPIYAFWFNLKPLAHHLEGTEKQSEVTHPSLNLPTPFTREYLLARYVGSDNLKTFKTQFDSMTEWFHAWERQGER